VLVTVNFLMQLPRAVAGNANALLLTIACIPANPKQTRGPFSLRWQTVDQERVDGLQVQEINPARTYAQVMAWCALNRDFTITMLKWHQAME
jgi:hypothetical protein